MSQKSRIGILNEVEKFLQNTGYGIAKLSPGSNACFDIIAKRRDQLIIIKIEPYVDNFNRDNSFELKNIASFLNASPIIIGEKGRRFSQIEDGLVLLRYGIPVISTETFSNLIANGVPPIVYCSRGGYFVQINRKVLRQARIERDLSYADLAHLVGVSRRTIYEYEHSINPPPETTARLEEILDVPIAQGIRIFDIEIEKESKPQYSVNSMSSFKEEISSILQDLGFLSQFWTRLSPFDAFGEHKSQDMHSGLNVLVCVDEDQNKNLFKRISLTQDIASLTKRRAIMIVEDDQEHPATQSIPTFTLEELNQMKKAFDLVKRWVKKYSDLKDN
ncbi:MAG: helix-turn-helix domain-containing protein [Candidatus Heimdallarchaeota archaeon]|nr:helix-turn-helix domain-containing protein [Candidatus Heimdallarchaeota archaeon]MCK4954882.1 helix-turn-helix domain-containing protein [Candidatus Heimdallarchaeota archaeon]